MNASEKYLNITKQIVLSHINRDEHLVVLFGSRAKGTARQTSDIDVGIWGDKPLGKIYHKIINDLEESIVPFEVNIVDFSLVSDTFRQTALPKAIVWNKPKAFDRRLPISSKQ